MRTLSSTQAQKNFGDLVTDAMRGSISITRHAKEIFVIVPSQEYKKMKQTCEKMEGNARHLKKTTASSYIGSAKGLFPSVESVDDFIEKERKAWD